MKRPAYRATFAAAILVVLLTGVLDNATAFNPPDPYTPTHALVLYVSPEPWGIAQSPVSPPMPAVPFHTVPQPLYSLSRWPTRPVYLGQPIAASSSYDLRRPGLNPGGSSARPTPRPATPGAMAYSTGFPSSASPTLTYHQSSSTFDPYQPFRSGWEWPPVAPWPAGVGVNAADTGCVNLPTGYGGHLP